MNQGVSEHTTARKIHAPLQDALVQFQDDLALHIDRLIAGEIGLPPWTHDPHLPEDDNLRFLKSLNLPAASPPFQDRPSLLLHDLGCFGGDPDYSSYITRVFKPGCHTLLVNTSGAGKTRILLEGLCQHWGFYFTTQVTVDFVSQSLGSHDLGETIYSRLLESPGFTEELSAPIRVGEPFDLKNFRDRLATNRKIAGLLFKTVLLARLVMFEQYLTIMNSQGLRATSELKQRWLLLQIDPWILNKEDVFDSLVDVIISHKVDITQMDEFIKIYWRSILSILNDVAETTVNDASHIFLVVDEAQDAVEKHPDAFRSATSEVEEGRPRPVLRELINCWFTTTMQFNKNKRATCTFVITGTGISRDMMQEALSSTIFKAQALYTAHTTGGLDTPEAQLKYIKRYLPEDFLVSEQGRALIHRLWYWLGGRFRFTAEYIALLIQNGLRRPHALLNAYIKSFSSINATDSLTFVRNEPHCPDFPKISYPQIQYEKLLKRHNMMMTIKDLVYNYLRRSMLPDSAQTLGTDESLFVQYGFARYRTTSSSDEHQAEVCEPLILLAAAIWLNSRHEALHKSLCNELGTDSTSRNGFEDYLVYFFTRVFEKPTPLSQVFEFHEEDLELSRAEATLVAVHRSEINENVVDFSKTTFGNRLPAATSLSGCLGENAKTPERLEEWLQLQKHTAFCFPPLMMGPDILFVLELHTTDLDGAMTRRRYIWVAVQAKFLLGGENPADYISKAELTRARKTVTPKQFYINKNHLDHTTLDESGKKLADRRNTSVLQALDNLPHRETSLAGRHSLLRVIAVFPPEAKLSDLDINDPDGGDGHPLVCLKRDFLISRLSGEHPTDKLKNVQREHFRKVEMLRASKATEGHWKHRAKLERLRKLTLPSTWDHGTIAHLPPRDVESYLECFRLLLVGERVPKSGEGERRTKASRIVLLQDLLRDHFEAGGSASVAEACSFRPQGSTPSSRGRSSSALLIDADGDVHMDG